MLPLLTLVDFEVTQINPDSGIRGSVSNIMGTGVQVKHRESGAVGESRGQMTQLANRDVAFHICIGSNIYRNWYADNVYPFLKESEVKNSE